jgi:DHA1 family tetracycline resistance protein-like MFS transporter
MTDTQSEQAPAPRRAALAFIFVTVLLDMLALGMVIPVLLKLVEDFVKNDTAAAAWIFGIFGTAFARTMSCRQCSCSMTAIVTAGTRPRSV